MAHREKRGPVGRYFVSRVVVGCGVVLGKLRVPGQLAPGGNGSPQLHAQPSHHNREEGRTGYQRGSCAEPGAGWEGLATAALTRAAFLFSTTTERGAERDINAGPGLCRGAGWEGLATAALTRAAFLPVATTERGVERDTKTRVLG